VACPPPPSRMPTTRVERRVSGAAQRASETWPRRRAGVGHDSGRRLASRDWRGVARGCSSTPSWGCCSAPTDSATASSANPRGRRPEWMGRRRRITPRTSRSDSRLFRRICGAWDTGPPHVSPVLANIYLHYVLDWSGAGNLVLVPPRVSGAARLATSVVGGWSRTVLRSAVPTAARSPPS